MNTPSGMVEYIEVHLCDPNRIEKDRLTGASILAFGALFNGSVTELTGTPRAQARAMDDALGELAQKADRKRFLRSQTKHRGLIWSVFYCANCGTKLTQGYCESCNLPIFGLDSDIPKDPFPRVPPKKVIEYAKLLGHRFIKKPPRR